MLRQNGDFMGAVDVYSMYPVDEKILSVSEKSDDSRFTFKMVFFSDDVFNSLLIQKETKISTTLLSMAS
jgi:hypothetical protein